LEIKEKTTNLFGLVHQAAKEGWEESFYPVCDVSGQFFSEKVDPAMFENQSS
jgi:hypothetical protein